MKRTLALATIVALSLSLASCRKKNNEPIAPKPNPEKPAPTPGTNPNPGTNPAPENPNLNTIEPDAEVAKIKDAQAVFTAPAGSVIYILPKTGLHVFGATRDKVDPTKYTVGAHGLGISGDTESLLIKSDNLSDISLTKPMPSLKKLILKSVSNASTTTETKIDLSGLTEVTALLVAGFNKVDLLDLSKMTKLSHLSLGSYSLASFPEMKTVFGVQAEKNTELKEVKLPANNLIEYMAVRLPIKDGKLDVDNLPKLKKFYCWSPAFSNFTFAKSENLEVLLALRPTGSIALNVDLGNKPKLKDITLVETGISKLAIKNATHETLLKDSKAGATIIEFDNINPAQAVDYIKRTAKETKSITLKNIALTEDQLIDLISGLGATNGILTIKSDLLTEKVKEALKTKGWTGASL